MLVGPQPLVLVTVDSGSFTVQVSETLLVYHPLLPRVPVALAGGCARSANVVGPVMVLGSVGDVMLSQDAGIGFVVVPQSLVAPFPTSSASTTGAAPPPCWSALMLKLKAWPAVTDWNEAAGTRVVP